jgi:hypothetical protein
MSGILNSIQGIAGKLGSTFQNVLDRIFPPEQRAEMLSKLQGFAVNNPKLAVCPPGTFPTTEVQDVSKMIDIEARLGSIAW